MKPKGKRFNIANLERAPNPSGGETETNINDSDGATHKRLTKLEVTTLTPTTSGGNYSLPNDATGMDVTSNRKDGQISNNNNNNSPDKLHHHQTTSEGEQPQQHHSYHHHQNTNNDDWIPGRRQQLAANVFRVNGEKPNTYEVIKKVQCEHRAERELEHYNTKARHPGVLGYQKFTWITKMNKSEGAEITMEYANRETLTKVEKELANMLSLRAIVDERMKKDRAHNNNSSEDAERLGSITSTSSNSSCDYSSSYPGHTHREQNNNNNNIINNNNSFPSSAPGLASSCSSSSPISASSSDRKFREQLAKSVARQVFDALLYYRAVHDRWHRDIKPDNILCRNDGCVKLADFDVSRVADTSMTMNLGGGGGMGATMMGASSSHNNNNSGSSQGSTPLLGHSNSTSSKPAGGVGVGVGKTQVGTPDFICPDYHQSYKHEAEAQERRLRKKERSERQSGSFEKANSEAVNNDDDDGYCNNNNSDDDDEEEEEEDDQYEEEEFQLDPGKADVYSVGCVLFQILNHHDFERSNSLDHPRTSTQLNRQLEAVMKKKDSNHYNTNSASSNQKEGDVNSDYNNNNSTGPKLSNKFTGLSEIEGFSLGRPPFPNRNPLFNSPTEKEVSGLDEKYFNPSSPFCIVQDPQLRALLRRCLVYNPNHRASLAEAAALSYFFEFPVASTTTSSTHTQHIGGHSSSSSIVSTSTSATTPASSSSSSGSLFTPMPNPSFILSGCVSVCDAEVEKCKRQCVSLVSQLTEKETTSSSNVKNNTNIFDMYSSISNFAELLGDRHSPTRKNNTNNKKKKKPRRYHPYDVLKMLKTSSSTLDSKQESFVQFAEIVKTLMNSLTRELTSLKKCLEAKKLKDLPFESIMKHQENELRQRLQREEEEKRRRKIASGKNVDTLNPLEEDEDEEDGDGNGQVNHNNDLLTTAASSSLASPNITNNKTNNNQGMMQIATSIDDVTTVKHQLKKKNSPQPMSSTSLLNQSTMNEKQQEELNSETTPTNQTLVLDDSSSTLSNSLAASPCSTSGTGPSSNYPTTTTTTNVVNNHDASNNVTRGGDPNIAGSSSQTFTSTSSLTALYDNATTITTATTTTGAINNSSLTSPPNPTNQQQVTTSSSSPTSSAAAIAASTILGKLQTHVFLFPETPISKLNEKEKKESLKSLRELADSLQIPTKQVDKVFVTIGKSEPRAKEETVLLKSIRNSVAEEMKKRWSIRAEPSHKSFRAILKEIDKFKQLF